MRVKVNGERVPIPYVRENFAEVTRILDSVMVTTYLGVKVVWDGNSFLEISVPTAYKGTILTVLNFLYNTKNVSSDNNDKLSSHFGKPKMVVFETNL